MEKTRIHFYGLADLSTSFYFELADKFMSDFDSQNPSNTINDIIECYNILKYVGAIKDGKWGRNYIPILKKAISSFLSTIREYSLYRLFMAVETELQSDFWELFEKYGLYKSFGQDEFAQFLDESKPGIWFIIENEKLVNQYDECLKGYFLSDENNATIMLDVYEVEHEVERKRKYIPKGITIEEKDDLIRRYIESDNANLNYLDVIKNIINRDVIRIKDKTRLLAKRRLEKETDLFFEKNEGHTIGISIEYSPTQKEEVSVSFKEGVTRLVYSLNWINENQDYSTLLNNFIYLFEYVDSQMRITLTSKNSEIGAIESIFGTQSKNNYKVGWAFQHKDQISNIQLYSYINVLKSINIDFEDVIGWFFTDYLREHFDIRNFQMKLPSKNTTYLEKCRTIAPEIESILKKYNLFVEDGVIDTELLEISSSHLALSSCKSLFKKKYIYLNAEEYKQICYLFFSDQCMLHYVNKKSYQTFWEVLHQKQIVWNDFEEYQKQQLNWLIEKGYILKNEEEQLLIVDMIKMFIIRDLYYNETINYLNYPKKGQEKIDHLIDGGFLVAGSSLFSIDEQHYLNYYLNKSEYGNSLDLRNMYVHGTQPHEEQDERKHKINYLIFIKIIVLIMIKINDELCNRDKQQ